MSIFFLIDNTPLPALSLENDIPDYDMDSADETWIKTQTRLDLTPFKFEQMMDRLEKNTGQTVISLNEAKALLKQNDEISVAVFDYWLNKRIEMVMKESPGLLGHLFILLHILLLETSFTFVSKN